MRIPRPQRLGPAVDGAPRKAALVAVCALVACYPPIQPLEFPPIPLDTTTVAVATGDTTAPADAPVDAARAPADSATGEPAEASAAALFVIPVQGVKPAAVRDNFSASRGTRTHNALDIMAPRHTPVLAAAAGRILRLSSNPAGGITIYQVDAAERYVLYYAHLQGYRKGLRAGMQVEQGEVIGYVGTTGNAPPNTPHLHFQVMRWRADGRYWAGEPVNPHPFLVRQGQAR